LPSPRQITIAKAITFDMDIKDITHKNVEDITNVTDAIVVNDIRDITAIKGSIPVVTDSWTF
jgi:hypothetical protein